jgi:hypothetical protein
MCSAIARETAADTGTGTWSLCWQAAVGRNFFVDPTLIARIRGRLIGAHQRSGRVLVDFVLLPTEIHAVAQIQTDDSVGGVARAFGNVLSRWVREVQPVRSPVLAGPFHAHPIESIDALRSEFRMLAWRPVLQKLCTTPTHHPHGALRIALGLTPSKGFDARPMLQPFGDSVPLARAALKRWVSGRPTEQEWREWELTRGLELATGSAGLHPFLAKTVDGSAAALIAAGGSYGVEGALELLERWVSARIHPTGPLDLRTSADPLAARGRALVAGLAVAHGLCSGAAVARHFLRAKATLSEQLSACRARPSDRLLLATPLRRILEESAALRGASGAARLCFPTTASRAPTSPFNRDAGVRRGAEDAQPMGGPASIQSSISV